MALANDIRIARNAGYGTGLVATLRDVRARALDWVLYRRTIRELDQLTARELSDLGLSRSGVKAAAREAVYGR
ncbi:uncharacterized protein DUF1127 [Hasllibacter halocynthiae]|uniref:Uncharacterized protein DUF1127 n=1 Tax=Hasllibacter halocynthiae TaxID=595589 RepID=A0A2T0X7E0_9RHOB|nr:DUF1127 domain-containing protein [Hasllibacter halocynthiae]PRY94815.1 uncharacterized protein DUF1127 [Hasllibacter halocynthiae]